MLNLTKNFFSKHVFSLLNKNLNFCPTPCKYNKNSLQKEFERFFRLVKLKAHFRNKKTTISTDKFESKSNSSWTPENSHHSVNTFISLVQNEIDSHEVQNFPADNLTKQERIALSEIENRNDIIVTKADKGGAVVIMDIQKYKNECYKQLNDTKFYKKLEYDPTNDHRNLINSTIQELQSRNLISEAVANNLLNKEETRTPRFYALPKTHKVEDPNPDSDVPGRPVISSVDSHSSKISDFVDHNLQPYVKDMKSYVKDTSDFVRKINGIGKVPEGSILVTMDVRALYTNIPNEEGIRSVKSVLNKNGKTSLAEVLAKFLQLILTCNNFVFNNENYIQTKGCAMGTICAPSYANLFMESFEEENIYPKIKELILIYLRYIDDIFLIWTSTEEKLLAFIEELNNLHESIKFDVKYSTKSINMLDTTVFIDSLNFLRTTLYVKPTDRQSYLHYKSEHPTNMKNNIPYSQALRIKRICSSNQDYKKHTNNLKNVFISRGYKEEHVNDQLEKAEKVTRSEALVEKEKAQLKRIPLVVTFNRTLPDIRSIINKHWPILQVNAELKDVFSEPPILAFKRNKNLKDFIGSNRIVEGKVFRPRKGKEAGTCSPCWSKTGALCCSQISTTSTFKSTDGKQFEIRHNVNCKSCNVIYTLFCVKCNKVLYTGKSEYRMNIRINKHRFDSLSNEDNLAVCKHFHDGDHVFNRDAKFTIIEQVRKTFSKEQTRSLLEQRENFWIKTLKTLKPYGLNQHLNRV